MAAADNLSEKDKEFLAKCEEEFKHRFTEDDEEYMKVFNSEPSIPPIIESWWCSQKSDRRDNRHQNRRYQPYERHHRDRYNQDRRQNDRRGYNDYNSGYDRGYGGRNQRPRYY